MRPNRTIDSLNKKKYETFQSRFMGVRLEHVVVDVQDLLQLQYEGVAVMNMFGKARYV